MSDYIARHESCTQPSVSPDANLRAYARENGLQTALIAAKFNGTHKLYTYWGHTGIKSGDLVEVMVPRGRGREQETIKVRVWAVVPATRFKHDAIRTAKHLLRSRTSCANEAKRNAEAPMLQTWYNKVLRDIEPMPKTEHAKACVGEIDGMLSNGDAIDLKVTLSKEDHAYYAVMEHKPLEEVRKMFMCDFETRHDDQVDALARGNKVHRQLEKSLRLGEMYGEGPLATKDFSALEQHMAVQGVIDAYRASAGRPLVDFWNEGIRSGRMTGPIIPDNLPRTKRYRPTFRLSELETWPCGHQPKETPMSAKIENVTYVTLPNGARYDAKAMSAQQFFDAISALEKEVAKLDGISHKPRTLQQRIDELNGQIEQLSALCDSLHAAKEEPKTDSLGVPYGSADAATTNEA